ncbi:MAG: hypothetical protein LQ348_006984 [Seirophora lacunosa]|nr:MAG: hypothetical protein LQ348_006984 [Seirophora lacunosa]
MPSKGVASPNNNISSQDFVNLHFPRHSNNGSKRSRASSVHSPNVRLSIIEEDADIPPLPAKAHHRPFHRRWNLGDPPRISFEIPPPKYSVWDATGPKGEKLSDVRNNKHIARRGGWRRICLIAFLLIALIVGLTVGLTIGLRKRDSKPPVSPQSSGNTTPLPDTTGPFPAGSYTLTTFLDTVQTGCSSRPEDWSCFPKTTYQESPLEATANFTWVITKSGDGFSVASTNNPWSINFGETPLTMVDAGTDNERYQFNTALDKITIPSIGVNCLFNDTNLEGKLYTKKAPTYLSSSPLDASNSAPKDNFMPWPYAVDIRQSIGGGQTVPQCFRLQGNQRGDRITNGITPQPESSACSCEYRNFGS